MKIRMTIAAFLAAASLGATDSYGADGFVKGTIEFVRLHEAAYSSAWVPPRFWFTLNGLASAGACPVWTGRVLFVSDSKEAYLMILSAHMTGKEVAVYYSDAQQVNGLCRALYITVGNPPPLN